MPAVQQASSPAITAQLTEIEGELAAMRQNPGVDTKKLLKRMDESLSSLELKLGATQAEVGKLSSNLAGHVSKHPVLSGYRLLAVVGDQAVVEDMGTGRVAVLKTNEHLGGLTVYQVSGGEVVTNYGVFGG
ncbi:hypothetical protein Thpro_022107 [Acidihalobacter prosperus]|uniref:Uncharacterized protein n=2 Tax=Acidihalobacter prosperus TaxID=160660 RepID=A0A1A6C370_9GAMM|nr:hypothetical protein Thpro_022107 [Acidihalobacter prosperus]